MIPGMSIQLPPHAFLQNKVNPPKIAKAKTKSTIDTKSLLNIPNLHPYVFNCRVLPINQLVEILFVRLTQASD
jgi:hypothetical protein